MLSAHIIFMIHLVHFCMIIAAICSTAFPLIYAFIRWWTTPVGRVLMLKAVAFAMALDFTVFFQYVSFDPNVALLIECIIMALIAIQAVGLIILLVKAQLRRHRLPKNARRYGPGEVPFDGTIEVHITETGKKVYSLNLDSDPETLDQKEVVTFKVDSVTTAV